MQGNFDGFLTEDEQTGFYSAKPSTKKEVIVTDFKFVVLEIPYFVDMMMAAPLKDTQRKLCV